MNTIKKLTILLLALLALTACHHDDEPDGAEFFQNLTPCPTDGIYEGRVFSRSSEDKIGIWCEITKSPGDVDPQMPNVPKKRTDIYISRDVFLGYPPKDNTEIKFQILGIGHFPPEGFPYNYYLLWDRSYYICNINLIAVNITE